MMGSEDSNQERGIKVEPMHRASQPGLLGDLAIIKPQTLRYDLATHFCNHSVAVLPNRTFGA